MYLVTPLSLGIPVRPVALRPHLSGKFAFVRFESSLAHKKHWIKERDQRRPNVVPFLIMQNAN